DDELLEQTQSTEGNYSTLGVENEEEARAKIKEIGDEEKYKDQEGVEYKVEYTDNTFIETFKVDYTVADLGVVSSLPEGTNSESKFVSYQLSVDNLKKQGYYVEDKKTTKNKENGEEKKNKDQEGVEYKVEYTDNTFIETFKVDYTVADLGVVSSLPEGTNSESKFVSYQLSVDNFKKQGYYVEGEQTTEVFRGEKEGYVYEVSILQDGKNKVLKQTTFNEQTYASLDLADKAAAEERFKDTVKGYEELSKEDGVNFDMKFEEDKFTVDGVIDYEKITDLDKVLTAMGIDPSDGKAKE